MTIGVIAKKNKSMEYERVDWYTIVQVVWLKIVW